MNLIQFLSSYSMIVVVIFSMIFSIVGIVSRELRGDKDHKITADAFAGGTVYSVIYLILSLTLLEDAAALEALGQQKAMICLFSSAGLVLFVFSFITETVLGRKNVQ